MVWCFEHCLKPRYNDFRLRLNTATRARDGRLICLRKAAKFGEWLSHQGKIHRGDVNYMMLVAWRELKKILQDIEALHPRQRPAYVVVQCDAQSTYERAQTWLQNNPCLVVEVQLAQEGVDPETLMTWIADKMPAA